MPDIAWWALHMFSATSEARSGCGRFRPLLETARKRWSGFPVIHRNRKIGRARHSHERLTGVAMEEGR
jgi:hypothetical protein